jgi:aspartate/tyrosine/aromatic aminotransferase
MSFFGSVPLLPPNPLLGLNQQCNADTHPDKINLTVGAYRDDSGKPVVLESVRQAATILYDQNINNEYLPQDGLPEFSRLTKLLLFGEDSAVVQAGKVFTMQAVSGTGGLYLSFAFLAKLFHKHTFYIPNISWENHRSIAIELHMKYGFYRYVHDDGLSIDFEGLMADLEAAEPGSIFLLHMCAHNPTGVDLTQDQWRAVMAVMKARSLFPMFDAAYQGFASGDVDLDAFPVRLFAENDFEMVVAVSFAKNFALYGQRVGALHVVSRDPALLANVGSQLRWTARCTYSTCPAYGAHLVVNVLSNSERKALWKKECAAMAHRLSETRHQLYDALIRENVKGTWEHLKHQTGMFSYIGVSVEVVHRMRSEFHIYLLDNSRISLAGLNSNNLMTFVNALKSIMGTN